MSLRHRLTNLRNTYLVACLPTLLPTGLVDLDSDDVTSALHCMEHVSYDQSQIVMMTRFKRLS